MRPRGGIRDVVDDMAAPDTASMPDCRGVCGKREKAGDFVGCGDDVDLRLSLSLPSSSILSLMVFSFSSVACLLSSSDDLVPFGFKTPLNMMLYRSSLISGISMPSNPEPPVGMEGTGSEMAGQASAFWGTCWGTESGAVTSTCGSVLDLMMIGLCLRVVFFPATVLLLAGATSSLAPDAAMDAVLRFGSTASLSFAGSELFLLPNKPNSLLFWVLVLWMVGSGMCCTGGGE
jgi:hypothetical protein